VDLRNANLDDLLFKKMKLI
jgi:hypothetical protein